MANLTLTSAMAYARLRAQDNDASVVDADLTTIINKWYHQWTDEVDPRTTVVASNAFGHTDSGNPTMSVLSPTIYSDVLQLMVTVSTGLTYGAPLEKISLADMIRLQNPDLTNSVVGTPARWALERVQSSTSPGSITIYVHPIPDATYYYPAIVRKWVTPLSAGTDKMDVADPDSYNITLLAASELAYIIGKDMSFVQGILGEVGDKGSVLVRRWRNVVVAPRVAPPKETA